MSYWRMNMSKHNGKDGNKQENQSHKRKLVDDLRNRLQRPIRVTAGNQPASDRNPVFGPDRPSQRLGKLTVGRDHAVDEIKYDVSSGKPADTFHCDPILKGFGIRASAPDAKSISSSIASGARPGVASLARSRRSIRGQRGARRGRSSARSRLGSAWSIRSSGSRG